jgi:hypothetical protein
MASIIGAIELAILTVFCLKGNIGKFLICSILFCAACFDVPAFVTGDKSVEVFSITRLPIVQGYPFLFVSLLPAFTIISRSGFKKCLKRIKSEFSSIYFLLRFMILIITAGIVCGIFSFIMNDNDVSLSFRFRYLRKDLLQFIPFCLFSFYLIYQIVKDDSFNISLSKTLFAILVGVNISSLMGFLGIHGYYGEEHIVLMPLSFFFSTSIIIFGFYKSYRNHVIFIIVLSAISIIIQLSFNNALGGKSWLMLVFLIVTIVWILIRQRSNFKTLIIIGTAIAGIIFAPFITNYIQEQEGDSLSSNKLTQATMLLSTSNGINIWYETMPTSPKIRIAEFVNVGIEYIKKPYFAIFGKGFGGGIKDHINDFGYYFDGAFSDDQYDNHTFVFLHESLNTFFLKFGLWGLFSSLVIMGHGFWNFRNNPWLVIGTIWIAIFVAYSISILMVGLSSLVLGFYLLELDKNNRLNSCEIKS